jgi:choline dehydrogenase-like flavoprotein
MGVDASYGVIVQHLNTVFDRSALSKLRPLREFVRVPAYIGARILGNAQIYAGLIEDMPYETNRVLLDEADPGRLRFQYALSAELHQRRREFRRLIKRKLRGQQSLLLSKQPDLNIPHACGTLRFGKNPASSVLNPSCRAHDIHNLYVADSSFMPTSLGINPGLMIAANSLRVADQLLKEMPGSKTAIAYELKGKKSREAADTS